MAGRECCGISQPKKDNPGVQGIDDKTGGKDAGHIPFSETGFAGHGIPGYDCLFEEYKINAHGDQEGAAAIRDGGGMFLQGADEGSQGIAQGYQEDIADPDTGHETKSARMPVVEALLDNRKNDGANRQGQNKD